MRDRMKKALGFKTQKSGDQSSAKTLPPISNNVEVQIECNADENNMEEAVDSSDDAVDTKDFKCPPSEVRDSGRKSKNKKEKDMLLQVWIRRARGLPVYDRLTMKANAYAIAILQKKDTVLGRSEVKMRTLNPRWDFLFSIPKTPEIMEDGVIKIEVRHVDSMGHEEVFG
jgi:hypothetical protein